MIVKDTDTEGVWYDVEWKPKGSNGLWRRSYMRVTQEEAKKQADIWASYIWDTQVIKLTLVREVVS